MELNREQIIKALECCITKHHENCCNLGKWHEEWNCMTDLMKSALSLIKELSEENERLRKVLFTDISVVRVSRGSGKTAHLREIGQIKVDAIRADTVRKMQEKVEKKILEINPNLCGLLPFIDQIAKEMLEEDT
jgi:hypothetical protein